ncbi:MAG TPA: 50S ribosomal protein L24 [Verrucomicrobiae bacterium]|jgi:large subunit ribosomal protein L24|nr:50S ribosomal protein L24 [Verrucomicrobiae bacterium]
MAIKIRKGDTVMVIAGDDKGKTGRVLSVDEVKRRVIVEKVNFVKRHTRARSQTQQGGILEKEAPIHLSNVMLYDPKAGKGVRVGVRFTKDGKRERVSRATGDTLSKE